jgi:hypothetical protein
MLICAGVCSTTPRPGDRCTGRWRAFGAWATRPSQTSWSRSGGDAERLDRIVDAAHALQSGKAPEPEAVRALLIDLVTNAVRTVRLANRPDDGVACLYSAIEKLAKAALQVRGINNSSAPAGQIPEALREEYSRRLRAKALPAGVLGAAASKAYL